MNCGFCLVKFPALANSYMREGCGRDFSSVEEIFSFWGKMGKFFLPSLVSTYLLTELNVKPILTKKEAGFKHDYFCRETDIKFNPHFVIQDLSNLGKLYNFLEFQHPYLLKRDSRAQFEKQNITPNLCGCL